MSDRMRRVSHHVVVEPEETNNLSFQPVPGEHFPTRFLCVVPANDHDVGAAPS